ncbi:MAG: hypothetical protein KME14_07585 [Tildeniella torsiva UHER 1998/13D]|jgi:hypothetical protein|nr:hypothetical protein [Tildeniella torsiva UHER 1998/13D]
MSATQTTALALTPLELAILGQLWAMGGTCDALTALPVERKSSMRQRERTCQTLRDRGWLDYDHDIAQFGLTLTGKTLLKLDLSVWPVTPDELMILRSCLGGRIHPGQIHRRVSVGDRQRLVERLARQGLIVVYRRAIVNLRLTAPGEGIVVAQL